jgi:hypothetical protein
VSARVQAIQKALQFALSNGKAIQDSLDRGDVAGAMEALEDLAGDAQRGVIDADEAPDA